MPLQNRVDPFGEIHAVPARSMFTGNRGIIHDPLTKTLLKRRWSTKAWIICVCAFRGRRREVMGCNAPSGGAGWTELFFLDEVTALAAGHRPCFHCRRESAEAFAEALGRALGTGRPKAAEIDARLHKERLASGGTPSRLNAGDIGLLPDGAMLAAGGEAYAVWHGEAYRWSFDGYGAPQRLDQMRWHEPCVLTPATTLAALSHGYAPVFRERSEP